MKKLILILLFYLVACTQNSQVQPPVGGFLTEKELEVSKNRARNLNLHERSQIEEWIKTQDTKFYVMGLNYWISLPNMELRKKKQDGERVSYQYDLYDFNQEKLYTNPTENRDGVLGKFNELKAVEDAIRYMEKGESAVLLVPSVLAYGTYGDDEKIPNDMPLIIKLKML